MPAGFGSLGIDAAYAMLLNVIYLTAAISAGKKGQHWLQALGLWSCASDSFLPGSFTTQPCSLLVKRASLASGLGLLALIRQTLFLFCLASYPTQLISACVERPARATSLGSLGMDTANAILPRFVSIS